MNKEILSKYNVAVPRYTSYPPANFFTDAFNAESYLKAVTKSNVKGSRAISIYIHIPFCRWICHYCGCNAVVPNDRYEINQYIEALKKEMDMVLPLLSRSRKIAQIHYGGGTPTYLPLPIIKDLNDRILSQFDCIEDPEIAIECHPGNMKEDYWRGLSEAGFNRVSIGVQDFDKEVLKGVRRKLSKIPIEEIVSILREDKIAINMDFIYGLPNQTVQSFTDTIQKAIDLRPDRIVTFSYAHVPWVNPLQKKLEEIGLPDIELKNELFSSASDLMKASGYQAIGLDHFVLPEDELYLALQKKKLHRNFQGYCSRRTTGQIYAFGASGISQLASCYSQNVKGISTYTKLLQNGVLPVLKGHMLRRSELMTREVITTLMCNYEINWNKLGDTLQITPEKLKEIVNYNTAALDAFAADGIIEYTDDYIRMCPEATPFVRNVAASLDPLMTGKRKRYSRTI